MLKKYLLIIFLFASVQAGATTYYVSSIDGNNSDDGLTEATAWATLQKVEDNQGLFNPGDFILFERGGTYPSSGMFTVTAGGSVGNVLTYGAYGTGARPVFTGTGSTLNSLFYLNGPDYITFTDIDIDDPSLASDDGAREVLANIQRCFYVDENSSNIITMNMEVQRVGTGVFWVGNENAMINCTYHNMRMVENDPGGFNDYGANPVTVGSDYNLISRCTFYDLWAPSFDFDYDGGAIEIYEQGNDIDGNTIEYCLIYDGVGVSEVTGNTNGLIWNSCIIINNGSFLNFQNGYTHTGTEANNCVFINTENGLTGDDHLLYNDVEIRFRNCVFYNRAGFDIAEGGQTIDEDYCYYNLGVGSSVGYTIGANSISDNATTLWASMTGDPQTWDFHPNDGEVLSHGVNQGNIGTDYYGVAGADNYMGVAQFVTVTPPSTGNKIYLPSIINGKRYTKIN